MESLGGKGRAVYRALSVTPPRFRPELFARTKLHPRVKQPSLLRSGRIKACGQCDGSRVELEIARESISGVFLTGVSGID
jgi:hypothetical protein